MVAVADGKEWSVRKGGSVASSPVKFSDSVWDPGFGTAFQNPVAKKDFPGQSINWKKPTS